MKIRALLSLVPFILFSCKSLKPGVSTSVKTDIETPASKSDLPFSMKGDKDSAVFVTNNTRIVIEKDGENYRYKEEKPSSKTSTSTTTVINPPLSHKGDSKSEDKLGFWEGFNKFFNRIIIIGILVFFILRGGDIIKIIGSWINSR